MSDRDWVACFFDDVDQVLKNGSLDDSNEAITDEYAEVLSVVQILSSIDFSSKSKKRYALRQRLLAEIDSQKRGSFHLKENVSMNTLFQRRSIKSALSVMILLVCLGLLFTNLVWPGSVAAAAHNAVSFVQRLWVGKSTSVDPISPAQIIELENGDLTILVESEFAGTVAQTGSSTAMTLEIRRFDDLAEAQAFLPFQLVQPSYLPEAYHISYAKVFGESNLASVHLHFGSPDGDLLLSQRPVGGQSEQTVSIGIPDDYVIESVLVNGQPATWAEHILIWETDSFSFLLSGPDLDLVEAILIAESLE